MTEAIKAAENVRDKVNLLALMETIRHAYLSGRIPKVAARIGSALSIKPIISISDGAVDFVGLARTKESKTNHTNNAREGWGKPGTRSGSAYRCA